MRVLQRIVSVPARTPVPASARRRLCGDAWRERFARCDGTILSAVEILLLILGLGFLAVYGWSRADAAVGSAIDMQGFEQEPVDTTLWSESRLRQYELSIAPPRQEVVGLLRIPQINLRAPLYSDTREAHLNRGVGLIPAMSVPGEGGNLGIAGHRDGFFRALKDIGAGQYVEVLTREHLYRYRISSTAIVERFDTTLLRRTQNATITLVTCYPFYLVGHAPQRFIVRGELTAIEANHSRASQSPSTSRR